MDRKQILAAMELDMGKSLERFNASAADLMNSTYIIVSGKISRLLQSVAASRPMYEYLLRETEGYNFVEEFRASQLRDASGRAYIEIPQTPAELIRFAFCMLYAIDTGKLNIERLLHTYFYDIDANTELRGFLTAVVKPFVETINAVFKGFMAAAPADMQLGGQAPEPAVAAPTPAEQLAAAPDELGLFVESVANPPIQPAPPAPFENFDAPEESAPAEPATQENEGESLLTSLGEVTCEIIDIAAKHQTISAAGREELLVVADAFNAAVGYGDIKSIKMMYISFKNTVRCSEIFADLEEKLGNLEYLMAGLE